MHAYLGPYHIASHDYLFKPNKPVNIKYVLKTKEIYAPIGEHGLRNVISIIFTLHDLYDNIDTDLSTTTLLMSA